MKQNSIGLNVFSKLYKTDLFSNSKNSYAHHSLVEVYPGDKPESHRPSMQYPAPSLGRGCTPGIEGLDATGGEGEEGKDHLPDNSETSAILRASNRSLSPFRRHSWESGRANVPGPPGDPAEPAPAQRRSVCRETSVQTYTDADTHTQI